MSDNVVVGQCSHIWVGPGVDRDIILVLEGDVEFLPILDDIDTDVEVGCSDLILEKECIQLIGRLEQSRDQNFSGLRHRTIDAYNPILAELTGRGPSSKLIPITPGGASHI